MVSQEQKVGSEEEESTSAEDNAEYDKSWSGFEAEDSGQPASAAGRQGEAGSTDLDETDKAGQGGAQEGQPAANTPPEADAGQASRVEISDDVLANADPAVRALVEQEREARRKAENLARSNGGRLAQALNELAKAKEAEAALSDDEKAKRAKIREDYGEVADPILGAVENLEGEVARLRAAETARAEAAVVEILDSNLEALKARHPDLPSIVADPGYAEWVKGQTPAIQRIVQENSQHVVNADDAALVFDLYKQSRGQGDPAAAEAARQAEARRKAQLEAGRTVSGGRPTASSDVRPNGGSYEDGWDEFEREDQRKAATGRR